MGSTRSSDCFSQMTAKRRSAAVRSRKAKLSAASDRFGRYQTLVKNSSMTAMRTFQPFAATAISQGSRAQHLELRADSGPSPQVRTLHANTEEADIHPSLAGVPCAETAPLGESGGTVGLENISVGEAAFLIEMVGNGGMDSDEFL